MQIFLNWTKSSNAWPQIHSSRTKTNIFAPVTYNIHTSAVPVLTVHSLLLIQPDCQIHVLQLRQLIFLCCKGAHVFLHHLSCTFCKTVNDMVHCNLAGEAPISCAVHNETGRFVLHLSQWILCCATPLIQLHPTAIIPANYYHTTE